MKSYEVVGSDGSVVLATDDPSEAYTLKNNTNDKLPFDRRPYFYSMSRDAAPTVTGEICLYAGIPPPITPIGGRCSTWRKF